MKMNPNHKQHVLGALDHIDGILGDVMHKSKQHLDNARQAIGGDAPDKGMSDSDEDTYAGESQPGGHTGHPFGGKDQEGAMNHHAGTAPDDEVEGASHRKFGGGKNAMWALLNR